MKLWDKEKIGFRREFQVLESYLSYWRAYGVWYQGRVILGAIGGVLGKKRALSRSPFGAILNFFSLFDECVKTPPFPIGGREESVIPSSPFFMDQTTKHLVYLTILLVRAARPQLRGGITPFLIYGRGTYGNLICMVNIKYFIHISLYINILTILLSYKSSLLVLSFYFISTKFSIAW
jgi:hypothetical protein